MEEVVINTGDTAWMLISTGLVVLMIPGLALFYGGMVRVKSVLNMMMMSFGALASCLCSMDCIWFLYGLWRLCWRKRSNWRHRSIYIFEWTR
jgi:ammonia channel protein AmtB